jgi:hypothetical protein
MLYGNRMQPARIPSATLGLAGLARPSEAFSSVDPRAVPLPESTPGTPVSPSLSPADPGSNSNSNSSLATHAKQIVQSRGTAFSTALDIARKAEADIKAERRKSAHWLTPQHTGAGALMPQFTGSSGLVAQYTGDTLTPQHTGGKLLTPQHTGSGLVPQYTGSSGTLIPQHTGGSTRSLTMGSPPLSPVGYSPRGFGSPGAVGRDRTRRVSLFSMEPLVLSKEDGDEEQVPSPRVLVGGREGEDEDDDDVFVAEPAELDVEPLRVEEESEQVRHSFPVLSPRH